MDKGCRLWEVDQAEVENGIFRFCALSPSHCEVRTQFQFHLL